MTDHTFAGLEASIRPLSDSEVRDAYNKTEAGSEEADLLAGEMERRNLDN